MPIFRGSWKDDEGVGFDADSFAIQVHGFPVYLSADPLPVPDCTGGYNPGETHNEYPTFNLEGDRFTVWYTDSFDVYLWWPEGPPWANDVPVDVTHDGGTTEVIVDQSANPGQWNKLGTWKFINTTPAVQIRTTDTTAHVAANAVAIVPEGQTPIDEIILDNVDAAFVGAWTETTFRPNYWPPDYRHDQNADKGNKTATYTPTIPHSGAYDVYMYWPTNPDWDNNVPVDINHDGQTDTVHVDQTADAAKWNHLGQWTFAAGTADTIVIRTTDTTKHVAADAFRLNPSALLGRGTYITIDATPPRCVIDGDWPHSQFRPHYWQNRYVHDLNAGKGTKTVTFNANLLEGNSAFWIISTAPGTLHNFWASPIAAPLDTYAPFGTYTGTPTAINTQHGVSRIRIHGRRHGSGPKPTYYPETVWGPSGYYDFSPWQWGIRQSFAERIRDFGLFPPFPPVWVTGTLNPDILGQYGGVDFQNTKAHWTNLETMYHLWWVPTNQSWVLFDVFPNEPVWEDLHWIRSDPSPYGPYQPLGGAIGIALVSAP